MVMSAAVIVLFLAGILVGRWCGRKRGWSAVFVGSLLIVGMVHLGHRSMELSVRAPFSWAIDADVSPLLMALAVPVLLSVLIVRLPERRKRVAVSGLMVIMFGVYSVLPVMMPLAARGSLLAGQTIIDRHGVCLQTHGYTCGPAAAVTCLTALGIQDATESRVAIEAHSGPIVGTDPLLLRDALNRVYGPNGVRCGYRVATQLDQVRTPFVATMWIPPMGGHYVAVLAVDKDSVIVGDPMSGRDKWERCEFERDWKGGVHEISRQQ